MGYAELMRSRRGQFALIVALWLAALTGCSTSSVHTSADDDRSLRASPGVHVVKRGDTLFSIAWQQGLDYQTVAVWNGIRPPYTIYPGQKIRLYSPNRTARPVSPPTTSTRTPHGAASVPNAAPAKPAPTLSADSPIHWQWPASGPILRTFDGDTSGKKGISIGGTHGNQVRAAAAGRVVYAGSGLVGYGRLIILKHNDTYLSAYGHNRDLLVQEGDEVRTGQVIAAMGSSGTNRIQLHFEIRRNGKPVDPLRYLPRR
ncbi:MAG: peptidoglycan DD-metalloendopeptidase family protein [Gammaproteobacteria bacterium]|nr:peptidoglycan DD-metalloendopeptidase family protein [Gammaproteobacteria bacterium]